MAFDTTPWLRDGDTVDAEIIRRALGTLIGTAGGIVTPGDLNVTQNGTPNMSVNVGTGQIWVPGTSTSTQGPYYGMNKATVNVPISASNPTNPRVDTIAVQVEDPSYGGSGTAMAPVALAGTPTAGVSTPPTTAAQAASDGAATVPASAYVIAYVLVPANATSIGNADITNVAATFTLETALKIVSPIPGGATQYNNASTPTWDTGANPAGWGSWTFTTGAADLSVDLQCSSGFGGTGTNGVWTIAFFLDGAQWSPSGVFYGLNNNNAYATRFGYEAPVTAGSHALTVQTFNNEGAAGCFIEPSSGYIKIQS